MSDRVGWEYTAGFTGSTYDEVMLLKAMIALQPADTFVNFSRAELEAEVKAPSTMDGEGPTCRAS